MANNEAPAWSITGQSEDFRQNGQGSFVHGLVVTFTTRDGDNGEVFIPGSSFDTANVRAQVDAKAQTMLAVRQLQG